MIPIERPEKEQMFWNGFVDTLANEQLRIQIALIYGWEYHVNPDLVNKCAHDIFRDGFLVPPLGTAPRDNNWAASYNEYGIPHWCPEWISDVDKSYELLSALRHNFEITFDKKDDKYLLTAPPINGVSIVETDALPGVVVARMFVKVFGPSDVEIYRNMEMIDSYLERGYSIHMVSNRRVRYVVNPNPYQEHRVEEVCLNIPITFEGNRTYAAILHDIKTIVIRYI